MNDQQIPNARGVARGWQKSFKSNYTRASIHMGWSDPISRLILFDRVMKCLEDIIAHAC